MVIILTADSVAAGVAACRLISSNVGRKWVMFSRQSAYVLKPLHLVKLEQVRLKFSDSFIWFGFPFRRFWYLN
jgi:hypothetical protein